MAWEVTMPTFGQPLEVIGGDAEPETETKRFDDEQVALSAFRAAQVLPYMGSPAAVRRLRDSVTMREVAD
jgi:hypothetical protein